MTESFPFHSWMPKPAGVAVLLALFVPLFFSGGTYLSNINEMAGSMGVQTEEFQFLSLCASIGMSMVFPFMVPYLRGRNVKAVYIGGYAVLALLNVVCAVSRNLPLLALCSFLIGFVRVALVLNTTFVIAPYMLGINTLDMFLHDPPTASEAYRGEHARTVLMPVLYCYILCIVQFSNFVSAWMAYEFSWEYTYWLVVGMMLAAILLVMLTFCKAPSQGCRLSSSRLPDAVLLVVGMGRCATCLCSARHSTGLTAVRCAWHWQWRLSAAGFTCGLRHIRRSAPCSRRVCSAIVTRGTASASLCC